VYTLEQETISAEGAGRVLARGLQAAETMGRAVSIAVVDRAGHLVAFTRMDKAGLQTIPIAINKARGAAMTGFPTGTVLPDGTILDTRLSIAIPLAAGPDCFGTVQGGVPLEFGASHIGAVGVSGASEREDRELAEAACAVLRET
jgi:glc operon protein GlcG